MPTYTADERISVGGFTADERADVHGFTADEEVYVPGWYCDEQIEVVPWSMRSVILPEPLGAYGHMVRGQLGV